VGRSRLEQMRLMNTLPGIPCIHPDSATTCLLLTEGNPANESNQSVQISPRCGDSPLSWMHGSCTKPYPTHCEWAMNIGGGIKTAGVPSFWCDTAQSTAARSHGADACPKPARKSPLSAKQLRFASRRSRTNGLRVRWCDQLSNGFKPFSI
jgi:hypothetical protein